MLDFFDIIVKIELDNKVSKQLDLNLVKLTMNFDKNTIKEIERIAHELNISTSKLIRDILEIWVRNLK
jgi:hypothetical protein